MPTRDEDAEHWRLISLNSRKAAQRLLEAECYRSSVSRSYYAAYAAITSLLIRQGITLAYAGNNPSHLSLPTLVVNNLTFLPLPGRFELNKSLRRLYAARIGADYDAAAEVGQTAALAMLRDLNRVFTLLAIKEEPI